VFFVFVKYVKIFFMNIVNLQRIFKYAFINFYRNKFITLASVLIIVITLSAITSLIFVNVLFHEIKTQIENKVDINIYFSSNVSVDQVIDFKKELETLPEVGNIEYISKQENLKIFKSRHKNDYDILKALELLDENPLRPILNIKAKQIGQYGSIAKFVQDFQDETDEILIDKVNYNENKQVIERLNQIILVLEKFGTLMSFILLLISILIVFNTIRLAIYISKNEISIMRLVGASDSFIRAPFMLCAVLYAIVASVITCGIFFPITYVSKQMILDVTNINIFKYYLANFWQIFFIILIAGILITVISNFFAVRKYLNE
jgi:cell division transport system permease protein